MVAKFRKLCLFSFLRRSVLLSFFPPFLSPFSIHRKRHRPSSSSSKKVTAWLSHSARFSLTAGRKGAGERHLAAVGHRIGPRKRDVVGKEEREEVGRGLMPHFRPSRRQGNHRNQSEDHYRFLPHTLASSYVTLLLR